MQQPCRPEQERVGEHVHQVDEAQQPGRNPERPCAGIDVLFAGGYRYIANAAVWIANRQWDFGSVRPEQQVAERDVGGIVGMLGERFFVDRHRVGQLQTVNRGDFVAGNDSGCFGLRSDREAHDRAIAR